MKAEEIINLALTIMMKEMAAAKSPENDRISRKQALKKYAGLLDTWVEQGLVPEIRSAKLGHTYYPKHRLEELWMIHMLGKEAIL